MGFLDQLSSSLFDQVGMVENKPSAFKYSSLGDFATKIDRSAHRQYVETGMIRNIRPRASEILMQEPDIVVVIKKRMFSSLAESYNTDLMDSDEKLFLRASKALFENKCRIIAAYERLTKFEKIVAKNDGQMSDFALPMIFNAVDSLNALAPGLISAKTQGVFDSIKKVKQFSDPAFFTTWNVDGGIPYATGTGDGTGTFDLTLVSGLKCSNTVDFGAGTASLTIEDPYKLMVVNNSDIEKAISDATSLFRQRNFFRVTESQLKNTIQELKDRLNVVRSTRGASNINFRIAEDTILYKKVRAIIDEEGREVKFTFDAGTFGANLFSFDNDSVSIDSESRKGINGIKSANNESDLFKQVINNIFNLMGLQQTTRSDNRSANKMTNNIRRKMQLHYGGKPIIQPMDVLTIFISSKTMRDSKITQGLNTTFAGGSLLNSINQTIGGINSAIDDIAQSFSGGTVSGPGGMSSMEIEKNLIAGPEFPMWLFALMKTDFLKQNAGTCCFSGIVKSAPHNYSDGKYVLTVNAEDNANYFKMGQINVNPSIDVYNSALYDPLTPFETAFDAASGVLGDGEMPKLLDANIRLLNSNSIRGKLLRHKGAPMNEGKYNQEDTEHITSGSGNVASHSLPKMVRRVFVDPDGFVYRWKEGIGSLVMMGQPHASFTSIGSFKSESSPSITTNPFAGQDVMNVLSLLITGQPYSYNNFVRGALDFAKLNKNDLTNESMSASFFKGLIGSITRNNSIWGNFVPFKKLVINERGYGFLASGEYDLMQNNAKLSLKLRQRATKYDKLASVMPYYRNNPMWYTTEKGGTPGPADNPPGKNIVPSLWGEIESLDAEIAVLKTSFENSVQKGPLQSIDGTLGIFGDDITFDSSIVGLDSKAKDTEEGRAEAQRELRKKLNSLTRRRLWKVRGNTDVNLFIVDDAYDKNYDIQAFEKALTTGLELFNSTYSDPFKQINKIKTLLGLEVFADSQGHIQARPPQYNRMPSSVLRDMLQRKEETGAQIFPEYLERLFFNNIQGLTSKIETIEDQIRLRAIALGHVSDFDIEALLRSKVGSGVGFAFLTDRNSGTFDPNIMKLFAADAPDLREASAAGALEALSDKIKGPLNATISFDIARRVEVISDVANFKKSANYVDNALQIIANRLRTNTRENVPSTVQKVLSNNRVNTSGRRQTDVLRVVNQIAQFISERQRVIKTLSNSVRNLREGLAVDDKDTGTAKALIYDNIRDSDGDVLFPKLLEHMIEYENSDDYGPGSGGRYILSDDKIISMEITETPPEYNMVEVNGKLATGLVPMPTGLQVGNGGNAMGTGWAVDYDLWRMYGFRAANPVTAPYLSDPNTQCVPLAVYLLNRARKEIFKGTVTVVGNEYIQAGEVYYIEDRDLLFYANSVSHSYTYSGQYVTQLELTYGHNPGEYIPTHLDIIGKGLYSNRHKSELVRHQRFGRADNSNALATLIYDVTRPIDINTLIEGQFGEQNIKNMGNMMLSTTGLLTPTAHGKAINLELRIYSNTDPSVNIPESSELQTVAGQVKEWILDPRKMSLNKEYALPSDEVKQPLIDPDKVTVVSVDLNPKKANETRSPSSAAWSMAENIVDASSLPTGFSAPPQATPADRTRLKTETLIHAVIDIWITLTDVVEIKEES